MALGPQQLGNAFIEEVDALEKVIDGILKSKKLVPNSQISIIPPPGVTFAHFQILKERYVSAGWGNVKWHDDQREGTRMIFDSKKPSTGFWGDER